MPAYDESSIVRFDMNKACGASIAPGEDITFDVIVAQENMMDVSIDTIKIKSDQLGENNIVSAMNFTGQISVI